MIFSQNFELEAVQRFLNLVDLGKCCKMSILLQNLASIQQRTSLPKFLNFFNFHRPQGFNFHRAAPPRNRWPFTRKRMLLAKNARYASRQLHSFALRDCMPL